MGLDIALGVVVLVAGLRGYFRGFLFQAIQLGALVGCIYLACPARDLARPYAHQYLPSIEPALVDKLLWWTAVVVGYVTLSRASTSLLKLYRNRTYAEFEPNQGDQGAGFLLGALKGALVAVFIAAGINAHAPDYHKSSGWVGQQVRTSRALALSNRYKPVDRVWNWRPVRALAAQVRANGFWAHEPTDRTGPSRPPAEALQPEPEPMRTASEHPRALSIPAPRLDPTSSTFLDDLDSALGREKIGDARASSR